MPLALPGTAGPSLEELGITINEKKSKLTPVQSVEYLGHIVDLRQRCFEIPKTKRDMIKQAAARELNAAYTTRARMARLLGMLQGARLALSLLDHKTARLYRWQSMT